MSSVTYGTDYNIEFNIRYFCRINESNNVHFHWPRQTVSTRGRWGPRRSFAGAARRRQPPDPAPAASRSSGYIFQRFVISVRFISVPELGCFSSRVEFNPMCFFVMKKLQGFWKRSNLFFRRVVSAVRRKYLHPLSSYYLRRFLLKDIKCKCMHCCRVSQSTATSEM